MPQIQQGRTTKGTLNAPNLDTMTGAQAAARTIGAADQNLQPLLQRLNSFGGKVVEIGTEKMVDEAKRKAVVDVQNGDFSELGLTDGYSIYDRAYDGAAETAYVSKSNTVTKAEAERIAAKNYLNPTGFAKSWDAYMKSSSKANKKVSAYVDAVTKDVAKQYGDAAYTKIATALTTKQYTLQKEDNEKALAMYEEEFTTAKLNGNEDGATTALINRNQVLKSMKGSLQITDRGILVANKVFEKNVVTSQVKAEFIKAGTQGLSVEYVSNFRDMTTKNKAFEKFTPTEIQSMIDDMHKNIKEENNFKSNVEAAEEAKREAINKEVTNTFDEASIAKTLTQDAVDTALTQETITPVQHKYYSEKAHDKGDPFTDSDKELYVVSNMANMTESIIKSISPMTDEDKMKYIKQLRTYKNSAEGKWTATVQGRAALKLLENKFNITQAGIIAKITKPEDLKNYNNAYQNFILEMEELPAEERERKAMHFAQASLDAQDIKVINETNLKSEEVKKRNIKAIEERGKKYQKQVGKVKGEAYIQGLAEFMQNFGVTGDVNFNKDEWRYKDAN